MQRLAGDLFAKARTAARAAVMTHGVHRVEFASSAWDVLP